MKGELSVTSGPVEGTVLEVKEEPGLGVTIDAMIYNGRLEVDDQIMVAGRNGIIGTRVRALLLPKPLDEIRDPRDKFSNVKSVDAAAGIKMAAAGLEEAIAGSSLYGVKDASSRKAIKERILSEVEEVRVKKDLSGVVVKSDALGSLEALTTSLEASKIPVRLADVGDVSRRDVVEAGAGKQLAVSIDKPMVGRQINEGDVLYVDVPVQHARVLSSKFRDYLTPGELALLSEMAALATGTASSPVA